MPTWLCPPLSLTQHLLGEVQNVTILSRFSGTLTSYPLPLLYFSKTPLSQYTCLFYILIPHWTGSPQGQGTCLLVGCFVPKAHTEPAQ